MTTRPTTAVAPDDRLAEIIAGYLQAAEEGQAPDRRQIVARHPDLAAELSEFFADQDRFARLVRPLRDLVPTTTNGIEGSPITVAPVAGGGQRFGDYELLEEIARGGMGLVFRARDVRIDRTVALKMILAGRLATDQEVERFRIEADSAARLDHPHIVPLYEAGEHQGHPYFALKLIDGGNLAEHLPRFAGDPSPRAAAELLRDVARAVHYAHQRGILHRDLKPANILLDRAGRPHVTDFGLAKRIAAETSLASSSAIVGTPSYMAPEQAAGKKTLSTAVDVFSLGAIFYELLTGRSPFRADTPFETLLQVIQADPERPSARHPRVDRDLETICLKCLAKEPEARYGSAEALADDLERWLAGEPILARPIGAGERLVKWARRRPSTAALAFVSIGAAAALLTALAVSNTIISQQKTIADRAVKAYRVALEHEQRALADARQTSYYQTIALAAPEALANNGRRADALLAGCPPELRQWEWRALRRLGHTERHSLSLGTEAAAIAYSPDGRTLAAAGGALGDPGTVRLWDAATGKPGPILRGHDDAVCSVAFSPDGRHIVTASRDGTVRTWDAATGGPLRVVTAHEGPATCAVFSSDGRRIASAGVDRSIQLWDAASGRPLGALLGHAESVWSIAFGPDGRTLASASGDRTIRVWDIADGALLRTLRGHSELVHALAFSPDGRRLVSAGYDGTARVWDAATGREIATFRGHVGFVTAVAFSPDGRTVASAGVDRSVRLWNPESGEPELVLRGHSGAVWSVAFHPLGSEVASAGEDGTLKLWDATPAMLSERLRTGSLPLRRIALSRDGRRLAVARGDDRLELWDTADGVLIRAHEDLHAPIGPVALSPDGSRIALSGEPPRNRVVTIASAAGEPSTATTAKLDVRFDVEALGFAPDGSRLAVFDAQGGVTVWDVASRTPASPRLTLASPSSPDTYRVTSALIDPAGGRLAVAWDDGQGSGQGAAIVDPRAGKVLVSLRGLAAPLAFSPAGRLLVGAAGDAKDHEGCVVDAEDGRRLARLRGHTGPIRALECSPNGARIASASQDGTLKLWDAATGRELLSLPGGPRPAAYLRFSADGARLVAASDDGTIRVWDATPLAEDEQHVN